MSGEEVWCLLECSSKAMLPLSLFAAVSVQSGCALRGPHTSPGHLGSERLHPIANAGEVNLGTVDARGVHSRSQGFVDLLRLIVHKLVCV